MAAAAYGDTLVMHNDMQHDYFPSSGYHSSGVLTPDVGLDYLPSPDWYPQWSPNNGAHHQSWYTVSHNDLCHAYPENPMTCGTMAPMTATTTTTTTTTATTPLSPQISPRTSFFPRIPASQISPRIAMVPQMPQLPEPPVIAIPVPSMRQKRKRSPESIDLGQRKKVQMAAEQQQQQHTMIISPSTSSPQSSTSSPSEVLSTRAHYAVEKRYRSTLNERYATLARIVSSPDTMEICRTAMPEWEVPTKLEVPDPVAEKNTGKRQSKTTTLSVALHTIELLDRACVRKAREYQELSRRLSTIVGAATTATATAISTTTTTPGI